MAMNGHPWSEIDSFLDFPRPGSENPGKLKENKSKIKVFGFKIHFWTSQEAQMMHLRPSKASRRPIEAQNGPFEAILGPRKEPLFVYLSKSSKLSKSLEIHSTDSPKCVTFANLRL